MCVCAHIYLFFLISVTNVELIFIPLQSLTTTLLSVRLIFLLDVPSSDIRADSYSVSTCDISQEKIHFIPINPSR